MLDYSILRDTAAQYGDAYYLFSPERVKANYQMMERLFQAEYKDFAIAYALKVNYLPALCSVIESLNGMAEVSSELEYHAAQCAGFPGDRMIYNGPNKDTATVQSILLAGGIVNLDSVEEWTDIQKIISEYPQQLLRIGIRCNFSEEGNRESRFGIDVSSQPFWELLETLLAEPNVQFECLHCHVKGRKLADWQRRIGNMFRIYQEIFSRYATVPRILNLGGGLPISDADGRIYSQIASGMTQMLKMLADGCSKPIIMVEPGTALVLNSTCFVTRVARIKKLGNRIIAVLNATTFQVNPLHRDGLLNPVVYAADHDYTDTLLYDLVGDSCLEDDIFCRAYRSYLQPGDYVVFQNVGAYSFVLKPPFITLNAPVLAFDEVTHSVAEVKRREKPEDILYGYTI